MQPAFSVAAPEGSRHASALCLQGHPSLTVRVMLQLVASRADAGSWPARVLAPCSPEWLWLSCLLGAQCGGPGQTPHVRAGCLAEGWQRCHALPLDPEATGCPSRVRVEPPFRPHPDLCAHDLGVVVPWTLVSGPLWAAAPASSGWPLGACCPADQQSGGPPWPSCAARSPAPAPSSPLSSPRICSLRLWACLYLVYQPGHPRWAPACVCQRRRPCWCPAGAGSELGECLGHGNSLTRPRALACGCSQARPWVHFYPAHSRAGAWNAGGGCWPRLRDVPAVAPGLLDTSVSACRSGGR